jgi:hypothetical protein
MWVLLITQSPLPMQANNSHMRRELNNHQLKAGGFVQCAESTDTGHQTRQISTFKFASGLGSK